jgi:hypothetical protein
MKIMDAVPIRCFSTQFIENYTGYERCTINNNFCLFENGQIFRGIENLSRKGFVFCENFTFLRQQNKSLTYD